MCRRVTILSIKLLTRIPMVVHVDLRLVGIVRVWVMIWLMVVVGMVVRMMVRMAIG